MHIVWESIAFRAQGLVLSFALGRTPRPYDNAISDPIRSDCCVPSPWEGCLRKN